MPEITRDGNGWAAPALIAERVHLADVAGLLRDAIAASGSRAERLAELPSELAGAGQLHAPARLLAAMECRAGGRGLESAVRTTDIANKRIVAVQPEQTSVAAATACNLGRQLTSITAALETLPLGRPSLAVVEQGSSAHQGCLAVRPADLALAPAVRCPPEPGLNGW